MNLADEDLTDPVFRENWKMVPPEMRRYIRQRFGEGEFWVRKDMLNNTVGYRAASVGDFWTQETRVNETTQKVFRDVTTALMGKDAYPWLMKAEKAWQAGIGLAKHTIVVRSLIVPMANMASNVVQLMSWGVGVRAMGSGFRDKLAEIDQHQGNMKRRVELRGLKAKHVWEPEVLKWLKAEIAQLHTKPSVAPGLAARWSIWGEVE